ncbi:PREDICTED: uncharacterized protein LOC109161659 [Ipomoea nil]|uniref:uncharacterized protein LOC109161659 n=1 Tax=Ipomoea nil TaxID=35883 RepID=UPI0009014D18|nr:PREDICTED: uncharacterized protein LOC109161659 [Ipomoea nil]
MADGLHLQHLQLLATRSRGLGPFESNCSPLEAEAWALLKGIQIATSMGFRRAVFESDSEEIIRYMNRVDRPRTAAHNILETCKKELRNMEIWQVELIVRDQNQVADALAKISARYSLGLHILWKPPDEVLGLIEDDSAGVPRWRETLSSS